jgi:excisionase family DNA binding protein
MNSRLRELTSFGKYASHMTMTEPELLTLADLAKLLRVSPRTAYRYVYDGTVSAVKVGGQWRIPRAELEAQLGRNVDTTP